METLEELREKFSNLDKERTIVYTKILKLEQQEITNNFSIYNEIIDNFIENDANYILNHQKRED